jgi:hypothetical protein
LAAIGQYVNRLIGKLFEAVHFWKFGGIRGGSGEGNTLSDPAEIVACSCVQ